MRKSFGCYVFVVLSQIVVQVAFGSYGVVLKFFAQSADINPLVFSLLRDVLATPVLLYIAYIFEYSYNDVDNQNRSIETRSAQSGKLKVPNSDSWRLFAILGLLGMFGNQILFIEGVYLTTASIAAMFQPLIPIFAAVLAAASCTDPQPPLNKIYTWCRVGGIIVAVTGSFLILFVSVNSNSDEFGKYDSSMFFGILCLIGNTLCMAGYVVIQNRFIFFVKDLPENEEEKAKSLHLLDHICSLEVENQLVGRYYDWKNHPITVTAWSYLFGAILMGVTSIYYIFVDRSVFTSIDRQVLIPLMYSVLISSSLCYALLTFGNKYLSSTIVTSFWPLQIATAVALSFLLFHETLTILQWLGCLAILVGLAGVTISDHYIKSSMEP